MDLESAPYGSLAVHCGFHFLQCRARGAKQTIELSSPGLTAEVERMRRASINFGTEKPLTVEKRGADEDATLALATT
jgi:hypothetical protein